MPHWMKTTTLAGAVLLIAPGPAEAQIPDDLYEYPEISIAGSTARCAEIARADDGLLAYRYAVQNASRSDAGIHSFLVDVSAPRSVDPVILATRGEFRGDATTHPDAPSSHVPFALHVPEPWIGFVEPDGWVKWRSEEDFVTATHPIEPGDAREDLVLRSSYLPGVRAFRLLPDYPHLCCPYEPGDPRNDAIDVKEAEDFQVTGPIVGPTCEPEAMNLEVLGTLLDRACGELGWISNAGVCRSLRVKLEQAGRANERGRTDAARGRLESFLAELDTRHGDPPGKHVNDDAYGLLRTNGAFLLERLLGS